MLQSGRQGNTPNDGRLALSAGKDDNDSEISSWSSFPATRPSQRLAIDMRALSDDRPALQALGGTGWMSNDGHSVN
jgi:hypothetical protein